MHISIDAAAASFRELVDAVRSGEEVVITDEGLPVVRMEIATRSGFRYGLLAHLVQGPVPDFLEPMEKQELALWEGRVDKPS
jgi:antitoxin (DNA-binding transcriptional repressor) of toxin-antitoxin stability system